eukprot:TRINITY_DN27283_c0_g1_i1.p1 TRINITY_DN27283_c0_g1~~TRINITY_DN27283_c0_g1_i1.p1  ORF type:complete len:504 (-),score=64.60 TRINITY_DN27283_c0_g1_i1:288-1799(-)
MIDYDPGRWSVCFAFSLHGSIFSKSVFAALPCSVFTVTLHILFSSTPSMAYFLGAGSIATTVLSGFTFVLGFLVVFRSQKAYARWWEGGSLLQQLRGEWFNAFSSLLAFCSTLPEKQDDVVAFKHQLARLVSLLYSAALSQVSTAQEKQFEVIDIDGFDLDHLSYLRDSHDMCEVVLQWIQRLIIDADGKGTIKVAPPILSRVYNQLGNGIVNLNNARKITSFPIPFPLAQMITIMLLVHWFTTAAVCASLVENPAWAGILSFCVIMAFWSINYIAVELEMPFGDDENDLPLHDMQKDLNLSIIQLMDVRAGSCPAFQYEETRDSMMQIVVLPMEDLFREGEPMYVVPTAKKYKNKECVTHRKRARKTTLPDSSGRREAITSPGNGLHSSCAESLTIPDVQELPASAQEVGIIEACDSIALEARIDALTLEAQTATSCHSPLKVPPEASCACSARQAAGASSVAVPATATDRADTGEAVTGPESLPVLETSTFSVRVAARERR